MADAWQKLVRGTASCARLLMLTGSLTRTLWFALAPNPLAILFESSHFVAVDKPAGWLSVPSRLGEAEDRPCVGRALEAQLGVRLWPIHRLDLEVTGILLFAKEAAAHRLANQWFEKRLVHKTYEAITDLGQTPVLDLCLRWEASVLRGKKRSYESPHGKPSLTLATPKTTVALADGATLLWQLEPHTGRSHQLRFDLARHSYPIIGDKLYGSQRSIPVDGIALRCVKLDFADCPEAASTELPQQLVATNLDPSNFAALSENQDLP